jgi:asparagine synthetase B (glutamine-hydrolysing)
MPMAREGRKIRITYNSEIYNSPELREELTAKGCRFLSGTDTEVILHSSQWNVCNRDLGRVAAEAAFRS